jgi:hypothetical protein
MKKSKKGKNNPNCNQKVLPLKTTNRRKIPAILFFKVGVPMRMLLFLKNAQEVG